MSGMLSTISNVLTTAVKSQKRIWPLNHAMTFCHLSAKQKQLQVTEALFSSLLY